MTSSTRMDRTPWAPGAPLPLYADRPTLARIISHHCFPVAPRTLRTWPLQALYPNGRVVYEVSEALTYAEQRLRNAPTYKQSAE